jgi:hypothetical protein
MFSPVTSPVNQIANWLMPKPPLIPRSDPATDPPAQLRDRCSQRPTILPLSEFGTTTTALVWRSRSRQATSCAFACEYLIGSSFDIASGGIGSQAAKAPGIQPERERRARCRNELRAA